MQKPFDLVDLEARLKAKGMPAVEGLAKDVAGEVIAWVEESLKSEANPLFQIGIPVLEALKPSILAALDKIDGK